MTPRHVLRLLFSTVLFLLFSFLSFAAQDLPPQVIYHFGAKENLLQNVALQKIPQSIWDKFIMGTGVRAQLSPFRRGLYGAVHPGLAANFGDLFLGGKSSPWFVGIHLREECRRSEKVAVISFLPKQNKFQDWLEMRQGQDLEDFVAQCYKKDKHFGMIFSPEDNLQTKETQCHKTVNKFLTEKGIQIVLDEAWPNQDDPGVNIMRPASWYIRDPQCIAAFEGTPEQLLHIQGTTGYWQYTPVNKINRTSIPRPRIGSSSFVVLLQSLSDARHIDRLDLKKIQRAAAHSDIPSYDPHLAKNRKHNTLWLRHMVPLVIKSFRYCDINNHKDQWQKIVAAYLLQSQQKEFLHHKFFNASLNQLEQGLSTVCQTQN